MPTTRDHEDGAPDDGAEQEPVEEDTSAHEEPARTTAEPGTDITVIQADPGTEAAGEDDEPPMKALKGEPGFRTPPDDIVEAAKEAPEQWLSIIDTPWPWDAKSSEPQPPSSVFGRWRTDENGEIVEWEANPDYRPSPKTLGWSPPVSPADTAVQLAATGYGPEGDVARGLAGTHVAVCVDEQGELSETETEQGQLAVPIFSASDELQADKLPTHKIMPVSAFLDLLPAEREVLFLSSTAPVAMLIYADELREQQSAAVMEGWADGPAEVSQDQEPVMEATRGESDDAKVSGTRGTT